MSIKKLLLAILTLNIGYSVAVADPYATLFEKKGQAVFYVPGPLGECKCREAGQGENCPTCSLEVLKGYLKTYLKLDVSICPRPEGREFVCPEDGGKYAIVPFRRFAGNKGDEDWKTLPRVVGVNVYPPKQEPNAKLGVEFLKELLPPNSPINLSGVWFPVSVLIKVLVKIKHDVGCAAEGREEDLLLRLIRREEERIPLAISLLESHLMGFIRSADADTLRLYMPNRVREIIQEYVGPWQCGENPTIQKKQQLLLPGNDRTFHTSEGESFYLNIGCSSGDDSFLNKSVQKLLNLFTSPALAFYVLYGKSDINFDYASIRDREITQTCGWSELPNICGPIYMVRYVETKKLIGELDAEKWPIILEKMVEESSEGLSTETKDLIQELYEIWGNCTDSEIMKGMIAGEIEKLKTNDSTGWTESETTKRMVKKQILRRKIAEMREKASGSLGNEEFENLLRKMIIGNFFCEPNKKK